MRKGVIEVAPGRFRETFGRYYEEFEVGHIYEHRPGRTITDADNVWFTLLTMNTHPLHFDYEYAKKTEFGKPLGIAVEDGLDAELLCESLEFPERCRPLGEIHEMGLHPTLREEAERFAGVGTLLRAEDLNLQVGRGHGSEFIGAPSGSRA